MARINEQGQQEPMRQLNSDFQHKLKLDDSGLQLDFREILSDSKNDQGDMELNANRTRTLEAIDDNYQLAMSFEKNVSCHKPHFDTEQTNNEHSMDLSKDPITNEKNFSDMSHSVATSAKMSKNSKIHDKQSKQKFEFIYMKSVFRHFCSYFKSLYLEHTENKKVHQNKLRETTEQFINKFLEDEGIISSLDALPIEAEQRETMKSELCRALMALTHPNKFNNALFIDIREQIETIRNVSQKYNQVFYQRFLSDPRFCFLFLVVFEQPGSSDPANTSSIAKTDEATINPQILQFIGDQLSQKEQWMFLKDKDRLINDSMEQSPSKPKESIGFHEPL